MRKCLLLALLPVFLLLAGALAGLCYLVFSRKTGPEVRQMVRDGFLTPWAKLPA